MKKFVSAMISMLLLVLGNVEAGASRSLDDSSREFAQARPGYTFSFPKDHGSHDAFRIEWWYFTGHLFGEDDRRFGYELTFFRRAIGHPGHVDNPSAWAIRHLYFAHFAITDEGNKQFRFAEKLSRAGVGKAGARSDFLDVWIDEWVCKAISADHRVMQLHGRTDAFSLDLRVSPQKPPVIHGNDGVSVKGFSPGQASHYYSLSRLSTRGILEIEGEKIPVKGISWMDHEFGSGELGDDQVGWDWFSIQLDTNVEIMIYQLRKNNGLPDPVSSGTVVFPDGTTQHLSLEAIHITAQDVWRSPVTNAQYPSKWQVMIPSLKLSLNIVPRLLDQELVTHRSTQVAYWEGAVDVNGQFGGSAIKGMGYVELTGYAKSLEKTY